MNVRILLSISLFTCVCVNTFAQSKLLTINDAVQGQRSYLAPKRMNQLQWVKGTNKYSYMERQGNREVIITGEPGRKEKDAIFASDLVGARMAEYGIDSFAGFPPFQWMDANTIVFTYKNRLVYFDVAEKRIRTSATWEDKAENLDMDPSLNQIAYTVENNLYIMGKGGAKLIVSNDPDKGHVYGGAKVHRNEYGVSKGTFWSPNSNYLAFYRMEESMVTEYPVMNIETHPATVNMIRYPMAGQKSHEVTLGIYDLNEMKSHYLNIAGDKEHYITNISWSRDETKIYVASLNRHTDSCWYQIYDVKSGNLIKTWSIFTAPTYVEPLFPLQYLGNSNKLIWRTYVLAPDKKSTREVIRIMDENGNVMSNLDFVPAFAVGDIYAFDDKGYYFSYFTNGGLDKVLAYHYLKLPNKKMQATVIISSTPGVHTISFNTSGQYYIDHHQSTTVPRSISIGETMGTLRETLFTAENPLKDYAMPNVRLFTIIAADNSTPLNCRMILPVNFDSLKKYPSITYVYNGPHIQLINDGWLAGADMWLYYMAQKGYVIFTVDGRGSGNRGKEFEQVIHRQLGTREMEDQLRGNEYLRGLSFIDKDRMGVYGWSFGGFMTTSLMTRTPGKYKVGVAGGAVIDWSYYEIMYTERYMDTPEENPEGYEKSNLLNYVDNLQGKLMLIHGTSDDVVVWQHTLMYIKKCVDRKKQVDYFVYPGHLHNVLGADRVHLMQKIANYFDQNL